MRRPSHPEREKEKISRPGRSSRQLAAAYSPVLVALVAAVLACASRPARLCSPLLLAAASALLCCSPPSLLSPARRRLLSSAARRRLTEDEPIFFIFQRLVMFLLHLSPSPLLLPVVLSADLLMCNGCLLQLEVVMAAGVEQQMWK